MKTDSELLRQFAKQGDEPAFAEVVRRHANMVYATAMRMLNDDEQQAQHITQEVFTDMARKANLVAERGAVAGWLYTSVSFAASSTARSEESSQTEEPSAAALTASRAIAWSQVRPLIDEAMGQLNAHERDAFMLSFFEEKSDSEVSQAIGLSDNDTLMCIEHAVEKLRDYLARCGLTTTAEALISALGERPAGAPPAAFVADLARKSLSGIGTKDAKGATSGVGKSSLGKKTFIAFAGVAALAAGAIMLPPYFKKPAEETQPPVVAVVPAPKAPVANVTTPEPSVNNSALPVAPADSANVSTKPIEASPVTSDVAPVIAAQEANTPPAPEAAPPTTSQDASTTNHQEQSAPATPKKLAITSIVTWGLGPPIPKLVDTFGVLNGKTVTGIASGASHCLALCSDGTIAAWGNNQYGQLGDGPATIPQGRGGMAPQTAPPVSRFSPPPSARARASSPPSARGGNVRGGATTRSPLPVSTPSSSAGFVPVLVDTSGELKGKTPIAIAAQSNFSYALCSDGSLYEWGGDPTSKATATPTLMNEAALKGKIIKAIAVSKTATHCLALCSDGTLVAWGSNHRGELGNNKQSDDPDNAPVIVDASGVLKGKTVTAIAVHRGQSLALCADGTLAHWGNSTLKPERFDDDYLKGKTITSITEGLVVCSNSSLLNAVYFETTEPKPDIVLMDKSGTLKGKTIIGVTIGQQGEGIDNFLILCSDGSLYAWGPGTCELGDDLFGNGSVTYPNIGTSVTWEGNPGWTSFILKSVSGGGRRMRLKQNTSTSRPILIKKTGALAGKNNITAIAKDMALLEEPVPK